MIRFAKVIQLLGIVLCGVGLIYGIAQNDMGAEFIYLALGVLVFVGGTILERRT